MACTVSLTATARARHLTFMTDLSLPLNAEAVIAHMDKVGFLPQLEGFGLRIIETGDRFAKTSLKISPFHLRIGNTISGPAQFTAADTALYLAIQATLGPKAAAVTSQLNIHFLKAGRGAVMITEARLVKLGRQAVGEVTMRVEGDDDPISIATGIFAVPT